MISEKRLTKMEFYLEDEGFDNCDPCPACNYLYQCIHEIRLLKDKIKRLEKNQ